MRGRYSDFHAAGPGELPAKKRNLVMHAELPIIAGHVLMATDMLRSMGQETRVWQQHHRVPRRGQQGRGRPRVRRPVRGRLGRIPDGRHAVGRLLGCHPRPLRHPLDGQPHPGILNDRQPRRLRESGRRDACSEQSTPNVCSGSALAIASRAGSEYRTAIRAQCSIATCYRCWPRGHGAVRLTVTAARRNCCALAEVIGRRGRRRRRQYGSRAGPGCRGPGHIASWS